MGVHEATVGSSCKSAATATVWRIPIPEPDDASSPTFFGCGHTHFDWGRRGPFGPLMIFNEVGGSWLEHAWGTRGIQLTTLPTSAIDPRWPALFQSADLDLPYELVDAASEVEILRWQLARPEMIPRVHSFAPALYPYPSRPDGKGRRPEPRCTLGPAKWDCNQDYFFKLESPFPPHLVHSQHFLVTDRLHEDVGLDSATGINREACREIAPVEVFKDLECID